MHRLIAAVAIVAIACSADSVNRPPQVATLVLNTTAGTLQVGDAARLTVTALDSAGATIPDIHPTWASSDTSIVIIDSTGMIAAKQAGIASAVVTVAQKQAVAALTVHSAITGSYVLASVNGGSPPVAAGTTQNGCPQTFDNATLTMTENPRAFDIAFQMRVDCPYPQPGTTAGTTHILGTWTQSGDDVTFATPSGASNVHVDATTTWTGGTIRLSTAVDFAVQSPTLALVFRKQ